MLSLDEDDSSVPECMRSLSEFPYTLALASGGLTQQGCQMAIARFLDGMCLALRASRLWLRYAALQNLIPTFPWIAPPGTPPWRNPRKGRDQILPSGNLVTQDGRPFVCGGFLDGELTNKCFVHHPNDSWVESGTANVTRSWAASDYRLVQPDLVPLMYYLRYQFLSTG